MRAHVQNRSLSHASLRAPRFDTLALVGIDLYRVSERDKTYWDNPNVFFGDSKSTLAALLNRSFGARWQLLCLIDPYDDTFIEHKQIGTLLKEFRLLEEYCMSEEERTWLLQAIVFIQRSEESKAHLRFVGD